MTVDHYALGQRWARGAEIVYAPLAEHHIATAHTPWQGEPYWTPAPALERRARPRPVAVHSRWPLICRVQQAHELTAEPLRSRRVLKRISH